MPTDTADSSLFSGIRFCQNCPAFLYYLVNDFVTTEAWRNARFGVRAFHHPVLLAELEELSPAITLLRSDRSGEHLGSPV